MRAQQVPYPGSQPGNRLITITIPMPVAVVMPASTGMGMAHNPQHAGQCLLQHLDHSGAQAPANGTQERQPGTC
jgi:hypothetical protein